MHFKLQIALSLNIDQVFPMKKYPPDLEEAIQKNENISLTNFTLITCKNIFWYMGLNKKNLSLLKFTPFFSIFLILPWKFLNYINDAHYISIG